MLFKFLKYLQPTNYFSLVKNNEETVFPILCEIPKHILNQLQEDKLYKSKIATEYDLSWQLIHKGYICNSKCIKDLQILSLEDEYRFVSKYFNRAWIYYIFLIRILSFNNPIKEYLSFYKTRHIKRSEYLKTPLKHDNWINFDSELLNQAPLISVIIPTLNRYQYLYDVLKDLEKQDYRNFELIIIDQSYPFQEEFYKPFELNLKLINQEEKALWLARNNAIKISKGDYVLLFDDDSRVEYDWITNHIKCLDFFNADLSSGVSISIVGSKVPEHYSFFRISDQLDTGNVLIKKEVFKDIGLFDRQFEKQRMGDGEFGLRSFLKNYLNISNPYAKRLHLKVNSGGLREMGSWDAFRTKKWFAPRPIPSVLYFFRKYYGNKNAKYALLKTVPLSIIPYRFKRNKPLMIIGVLLFVLLCPLILFQVLKSWKLSSKKIKQGELIERID